MERKPQKYDSPPVKTLPTASDTPAICTRGGGGQLSDYQRLKPTTNHHGLTTPNALNALNALNGPNALKAPLCTINQY